MRRTHRLAPDETDSADQAGQTTAEYALLTGAIALLVAAVTAWATSTGKVGRLLDAVFKLPDQGHLLTPRPTSERGQATVELALLVPFLVFLLMCIVQTGPGRARRGAGVPRGTGGRAPSRRWSRPWRPSRDAVASAAPLDPNRLEISRDAEGALVRVTVRYRSATDVPLAGALVGDVGAVGVRGDARRAHWRPQLSPAPDGRRAAAEIAACECHTHGVQWQVTHL